MAMNIGYLTDMMTNSGLNTNIFEYFWSESSTYGKLTCIVIPHTIIFENNKITAWYLYDGKAKVIIKKKRLNNSEIKDVFKRIKKNGEVVATFYHRSQSEVEYQSVTAEFLTKEQIGDFLDNETIYKDGILQEFVEPLEDQNNEYLVNFSDKLITIERIMNKKCYREKKGSVYDRYSVFPYLHKLCDTSIVTSDLIKCVFSNLTNTMADHISSFFRETMKIKFMNLVFKIGKNKKVYLQYCRRLICRPHSKSIYKQLPKNPIAHQRYKESIDKYPNFVMNSTTLVKHKEKHLKQGLTCKVCRIIVPEQECCVLSFSQLFRDAELEPISNIIKDSRVNEMIPMNKEGSNLIVHQSDKIDIVHFRPDDVKDLEKLHQLKIQKKKLAKVPDFIAQMYPNITADQFGDLLQTHSFMENKISACQQCFVKHTLPGDNLWMLQNYTASKTKISAKQILDTAKSHGNHGSTKIKFINAQYRLNRKVRDESGGRRDARAIAADLDMIVDEASVMNMNEGELGRMRASRVCSGELRNRDDVVFQVGRVEGREIKDAARRIQESKPQITGSSLVKKYYSQSLFRKKLEKIVPHSIIEEDIAERLAEGKEPFELNYDTFEENRLPKYYFKYKINLLKKEMSNTSGMIDLKDQNRLKHSNSAASIDNFKLKKENEKVEVNPLKTPVSTMKNIDFSKMSIKKLSRLMTCNNIRFEDSKKSLGSQSVEQSRDDPVSRANYLLKTFKNNILSNSITGHKRSKTFHIRDRIFDRLPQNRKFASKTRIFSSDTKISVVASQSHLFKMYE